MKVKCQICLFEGLRLGPHLNSKHKLTVKEYLISYPEAETVSEITRLRYSKAKKNIPKSEDHKKKLRELGNLFGYGRTQSRDHLNKLIQINRDRVYLKLSKEVKEKIRNTYIKNHSVEERKKNSSKGGVASFKKSQSNGFGTSKTRPEKLIHSIDFKNLWYCGDGSFWVTFKDGKKKNPDFIVGKFSENRSVIECYGRFWHKNDDPQDLINKYQEIGISCLVIWEDEIEDRKQEIIEFIRNSFIKNQEIFQSI